MGFTLKAMAKDLIDKHFKPEIDYKILLRSKPEEDISDNGNKKWGGHNRQTIMLNINLRRKKLNIFVFIHEK
jgi:hypothetical protein